MNIFYLDRDPRVAAQMHCDEHCVKMVLETAQLLCTAHHVTGTGEEGMYKVTHRNHPSALWVRSSSQHYKWTYSLFRELLTEFYHRRGKTHASERLHPYVSVVPAIEDNGFKAPPQCMPDKYMGQDTVKAYRDYYLGDKASFATWKWTRPSPVWWKDSALNQSGGDFELHQIF